MSIPSYRIFYEYILESACRSATVAACLSLSPSHYYQHARNPQYLFGADFQSKCNACEQKTPLRALPAEALARSAVERSVGRVRLRASRAIQAPALREEVAPAPLRRPTCPCRSSSRSRGGPCAAWRAASRSRAPRCQDGRNGPRLPPAMHVFASAAAGLPWVISRAREALHPE